MPLQTVSVWLTFPRKVPHWQRIGWVIRGLLDVALGSRLVCLYAAPPDAYERNDSQRLGDHHSPGVKQPDAQGCHDKTRTGVKRGFAFVVRVKGKGNSKPGKNEREASEPGNCIRVIQGEDAAWLEFGKVSLFLSHEAK